jgi:hypothetical protein
MAVSCWSTFELKKFYQDGSLRITLRLRPRAVRRSSFVHSRLTKSDPSDPFRIKRALDDTSWLGRAHTVGPDANSSTSSVARSPSTCYPCIATGEPPHRPARSPPSYELNVGSAPGFERVSELAGQQRPGIRAGPHVRDRRRGHAAALIAVKQDGGVSRFDVQLNDSC